jgi:hypothetical protein
MKRREVFSVAALKRNDTDPDFDTDFDNTKHKTPNTKHHAPGTAPPGRLHRNI